MSARLPDCTALRTGLSLLAQNRAAQQAGVLTDVEGSPQGHVAGSWGRRPSDPTAWVCRDGLKLQGPVHGANGERAGSPRWAPHAAGLVAGLSFHLADFP